MYELRMKNKMRPKSYALGTVHVNSKRLGRKIKAVYPDAFGRARVKWRGCYSITDIEYKEFGDVQDCLLATFITWSNK